MPFPPTGPSLPQAPRQEPAMQGPQSSPYDELFTAKEQQYNLPSGLLKAIAGKESSYRPEVQGPAITSSKSSHYGHRAMGLFQFMPNTWRREGHVGDPFNPEDATEAAAKKLSAAFDRNDNLGSALSEWYGKGQAPAGHPTTKQFGQDIVDRMNSYGGQPQAQPQPQQQQPQGYDPRQYGITLPDERDDFIPGVQEGFEMGPQIFWGGVAGTGGAVETAFGEGGVGTAVRNFANAKLKKMEADAPIPKREHDFDYSWNKAKEGDYGAMVDFAQWGFGKGLASVVQIGAIIAAAVYGTYTTKVIRHPVRIIK